MIKQGLIKTTHIAIPIAKGIFVVTIGNVSVVIG